MRNRCSLLHTMIGGANSGVTALSAVCCIIVRSETNAQSCLGKLSRDTGHSRVPEPPDRITGTIRLSVMAYIQLIRSFVAHLSRRCQAVSAASKVNNTRRV